MEKTLEDVLVKHTTEESVTSSNVTLSNAASSNMTSSNMTSSNVTSLNVAASNVTSSNVTSSNVASPIVTSSNMTLSDIPVTNIEQINDKVDLTTQLDLTSGKTKNNPETVTEKTGNINQNFKNNQEFISNRTSDQVSNENCETINDNVRREDLILKESLETKVKSDEDKLIDSNNSDFSNNEEIDVKTYEENKELVDINGMDLKTLNDVVMEEPPCTPTENKENNDVVDQTAIELSKENQSSATNSKEVVSANETFVSTMLEAVASVSDDSSSDSDDDSTSDESTSSSSDSSFEGTSEEEVEESKRQVIPIVPEPMFPFGNILLEECPNIAEIESIPLSKNIELELIGCISSIIDNRVVVVKASVGKPALNLDSVLFLEDKSFLGRVYETFGPVPAPYYVVCFNETEKTSELSLEQKIYFAPDIKDYTSFILTAQLTQAKGSDASWKDDREPPPQLIEFSDDEEERSFKKKLKNPGTQTGTKPVKRGRNNNQNNQSVGKQNNQNAGTWVNRGTRFANPTNQMRDADINWMMSYNQGNPQQGGRGGQYHQPPPPPPHFDQSNPYYMGNPRMWNPHPSNPPRPWFTQPPPRGFPRPPFEGIPPMDITMLFQTPPPPPK